MKPITQEYQFNRPAIFDWMVFVLSILLGFIFPGLGDFVRSPGFSWWMLGVIMFYITGAWLKHLPLSHRLHQPNTKKEMGYFLFLIIGHWCIMLVVMIFAEPAFFRLLGFKPLTENNSSTIAFVFIVM